MALVVVLIILGALLLFAETLLPGMVAGTLGLVCLIGAVVIAYTDLGPAVGNWVVLVEAVGFGFGLVFWFKYFPFQPLGQTLCQPGNDRKHRYRPE